MKHLVLKLLIAVSLLAPTMALKTGEVAPPLDLPTLAGGPAAVGSVPVVVWMPCATPDDLSQAPALVELVLEAGAQLVVIPVTHDSARIQELLARVPGATVLQDSDGRVILSYAGEFIPGVCPNPNLFVINRGGSVSAVRQYPGVAPSSLSTLLGQTR